MCVPKCKPLFGRRQTGHVYTFVRAVTLPMPCKLCEQDSTADVVAAAMVRVSRNKELKELGFKLLLQVRQDELRSSSR